MYRYALFLTLPPNSHIAIMNRTLNKKTEATITPLDRLYTAFWLP